MRGFQDGDSMMRLRLKHTEVHQAPVGRYPHVQKELVDKT